MQVVIFNWKGLPNKNTILQRLAVMTNAAEKVKRHEDEGATTFGHLVLLIRDISGKAGDIEVQLLRDEESATERNKIRRGLKKAFKSITVHSLPRPHEEIDGDDEWMTRGKDHAGEDSSLASSMQASTYIDIHS